MPDKKNLIQQFREDVHNYGLYDFMWAFRNGQKHDTNNENKK